MAETASGAAPEGQEATLAVEHEALEAGGHRLVLRAAAAVLDSPSFATIARELAAVLGGDALAPDPVQFVEFSDWRNEVAGDAFAAVEGALVPGSEGFAVHRVQQDLSPALSEGLEACARTVGAAPRDVLLAAWTTYRWRAGPERVCTIAVAEDGRDADPALSGIVGAATAYLPAPVTLDLALPFTAAIERMLEAREAATGRGERALADPTPSVAAFDVAPRCERYTAGGVTVRLCAPDARVEPFRQRLTWVADAGQLAFELDASTRPAVAAQWILDGVVALLGAAIARPATPVGDLPLVGAAEGTWLAQVARGPARPLGETAIARIVAAGRDHPERIAVRDTRLQLRYDELLEKARHVAGALSAAGVARGDAAIVLANRSVWSLVAIVGVMLAGAAYVPLDEGVPPARLQTIMDDCRTRVVIARGDVELPEPVLRLDPATTMPHSGRPAAPRALDDTAYILYTSGSAGRPKGVVISERGLANYAAWAADHYGLAGPGEALVTSPFGFDLTVTTLLVPLTVGGTVVIAPNANPLDVLSILDPALGASALKLTPRHLELLISGLGDVEIGTTVGAVVVGGEPLSRVTVDRWRAVSGTSLIVNEYGPTETVVGSAFYDVPVAGDDRHDVPIGRPIDNTSLYVLDRGFRPVPCEVAGELFIAGAGVARGYLGAPARTAERFLPDPFAGDGAPMYRTGDLVRRDDDGNLTYLGRVDDQLKIRGYRVEPAEVEHVLLTAGGVRAAAVVPSGQALVAFVVPDDPDTGDVDLLDHAAARLPDYMVPARIVRVHEFPLTQNGKVDRAVLARNVRSTAGAMRPPETELERLVEEVWRTVLEVDYVGLDESFFEVGGESLLAIEVMRRLQERLDRPLRVVALFEHPTIRRLASHLSAPQDGDAARAGAARAAQRVEARGQARRTRPRP